MYFVNMLEGVEGVKVFDREKTSAIPCRVDFSNAGTQVGYFTLIDGEVQFVEDGQGENIFAKGLTPSNEGETAMDLYQPKLNGFLKYSDIKDTQDNPIIVVMCKEIGIFHGVPANIKFLYMGSDCVLAALVYGACEFDGVPLQRCNTANLEACKVTRRFNGETIKQLGNFSDKDTGYNYLWDVVAQVYVIDKTDKKNNNIFKSSYVKSGEYLLDGSGIEAAKKALEAKKERERLAEEARQARLQKEREESEARRKAKEEAEAEALAEKSKKALDRASKVTQTKTMSTSEGAAAFLAAIANIQKG